MLQSYVNENVSGREIPDARAEESGAFFFAFAFRMIPRAGACKICTPKAVSKRA